jgi:malate synthase
MVIFIIMARVYADKENEVLQGCDGAWVAHPGMVKPIQEVFSKALQGKDNQISSPINLNAKIDPNGFAAAPAGLKDDKFYTEACLRSNISVGMYSYSLFSLLHIYNICTLSS